MDRRTGKGVLSWLDGEKYDGFFLDDKLEGTGVYYYANGDRYEGLFHNGMKHGRGIYHFSNGDRYFVIILLWSHYSIVADTLVTTRTASALGLGH